MLHAITLERLAYDNVLTGMITKIVVGDDPKYQIGHVVKLAEFIDGHGYTNREAVFDIVDTYELSSGKLYKAKILTLKFKDFAI